MSILLFSPFLKYGGAEKQFGKIRDILESSEVGFETISIDGAVIPKKSVFFEMLFRFFSVDVKSKKIIRFFKLPIYSFLFAIYAVKYKYKKVYAYSLYCLPALMFLRFFSFLSSNRVEIIYSERIYNGFVKYSLKYPIIYSLFDVVVVNSDELYLAFKNSKIKNLLLIRNYVVELEGSICCKKKDGVLRVALIARINREKNQLFILKELAEGDFNVSGCDVLVRLYGEVDDEKYYSELNVYMVDGHVEHYVSKPLSEIYRDNDLVCLPSKYEGTSNVILEAMVNKKDFLCSNILSNLQIPVCGANFFPLEKSGFISTLNSFIDDNEESIKEVRNENYAVCIKKYGYETYSKKILELFELNT
jgi:prepilin-type processing-associated H-X9-DG protein